MGSHVRVGEHLAVLLHAVIEELGLLFGVLDFLHLGTVDDLGCAAAAHNGDLGGGPSVVDVTAQMLGTHHAVSAAVVLAQDDRDFRDGAFAVGVKQLGAVQDDAAVLLAGAGQEAGHIHQRHDGDVEGVAETDKTGTLAGSVDVQHTSQILGLVGHNTHGHTVETGEADDEVRGIQRLDFQELAVVHNAVDDILHVIRHIGIVGDDGVQAVLQTVDGVFGRLVRGFLHIVGRDVADELTQHSDALFLVLHGEVGHA